MACQLEDDIKMFPAGDLTEIGEKGINLSGGQKARVSLARAVYKRPEVILMDDPISALDSHTRREVFDQVFCGLLKDSTRVLVTHAVDFVHLADRIVIMEKGSIRAQGTYDEIKDHEYIKQIQEIHQANKQEIKEAKSELEVNDKETPKAKDESVELAYLTNEQVAAKLEIFGGAKAQLDEETSQIIGKLLVEDKDENVTADWATYVKLWEMIGGFRALFSLFVMTIFFKCFELMNERASQEWAAATPEEQYNDYNSHMLRIGGLSILGMILHSIKDMYDQKRRRETGNGVHKATLKQILLAPINLFYDVTPIGKIMQIFQGDLRVFYGGVTDTPKHILNMISEVMVSFIIILSIAEWPIYFILIAMVVLGAKISKPYLCADNQLHKVGSIIHQPIHSYFHEQMRGTSIIRAYNQEESILARQYGMLDDTTVHFIAHHSCWIWYNLRMAAASNLIPIAAIITCIMNKGTVSNVTLCILFQKTIDLEWLMHIFGTINHFQRLMVQVQRVFNLQNAPLEKHEGEIKAEASWPSQGKIAFKDVEMRYRPNTETVLRGLNFEVTAGHKVGVVGRTGAGKSSLSMALTRIVELKSGAIEIDDVDVSKLGISDLRNAITMIPQDPIMFTSTLRYNLDPFEESTDERITELVKKAGLDYLLEGVSKQELKDKEEAEAEKAKKKAALSDDEGSDETKNDTDEPEDKKEEDKKEEKTEDEKKKEEDDKDKDKGLNFKVKEEGKNLSVGERQLLCIIRAILRCNKIVVLDEATANIDVITEQAIQQLITEEFKDATVLTIAHRLNTIIKSDRVLVMDKGMAIEYDSPKALMANPDSKFSNMLKDKKR